MQITAWGRINLNNTMVWYLAWRVATGLSQSRELSFMIPGHTRFSPDRFFELIKRKFRRSKVSSLSQIVEVVESSTTGGQNKAYVIGNECAKPFAYYDWSEFLHISSQLYRTSQHTITSDANPIVQVLFLYVNLQTVKKKRFWFSGLISEWIKMIFPLR